MRIALLGHDQPPHALRPSGGYISREDADRLVDNLVVERISQKAVRAFAPDSPLVRGRNFYRKFIPERLKSGNIGGVRFKAPPVQATGIPRTHYLPRHREKFGDWQLAVSL